MPLFGRSPTTLTALVVGTYWLAAALEFSSAGVKDSLEGSLRNSSFSLSGWDADRGEAFDARSGTRAGPG